MKVSKVSKMSAEKRFLYWIKERDKIFCKRCVGLKKPWTDDEILQTNFFTNPYRENDKTTQWFREFVRDPLQNDHRVLMATVIFRWFNLITTGSILAGNNYTNLGYLTEWKRDKVCRLLDKKCRSVGKPVFTGAFMINSPGGKPKLEAIADRITKVWRKRSKLLRRIEEATTLQEAHEALIEHEGLGGFMAYEIVCDLRYTYLLREAIDVNSWCNPGPGCIRGLYRIMGKTIENKSNATCPPLPDDWLKTMKKLLSTTKRTLRGMPLFEMREIEHSLCEFDKYERIRLGEGRSKRKYKGV